jgi:ELWxxDGT repeat protein
MFHRSFGVALAVALLVTAGALPAAASQAPYLVRDLRADGQAGVGPLTAVADRVFFSADDGVNGRELYVSDGTFDGTHIVKDIWLGSGSSDPTLMTGLGSLVFFIARDGVNGAGLYVSDGTPDGTQRLMRRRPCDSASETLLAAGTRLVFASKAANGVTCSLYASDGTPAGTSLVAAGVPAFGLPTFLNGRAFFVAGDDANGGQLWKTDGALGGVTKMVRKFPKIIREMSVSNHRLFMTVGQLFNGARLWKSDGTTAGTMKVKNAPSNPYFLTDLNGTLFFGAYQYDFATDLWDRSLWRSNGRSAGTRIVKDFGTDTYAGIPDVRMWVADQRLFFMAAEDQPSFGLWTSNGETTGTELVTKVVIYEGAVLGNDLYGRGCNLDPSTGPTGCEFGTPLFTSDGTVEGTHSIDGPTNLQPGIVASAGGVYYVINGELYRYVP